MIVTDAQEAEGAGSVRCEQEAAVAAQEAADQAAGEEAREDARAKAREMNEETYMCQIW